MATRLVCDICDSQGAAEAARFRVEFKRLTVDGAGAVETNGAADAPVDVCKAHYDQLFDWLFAR